MLMKRMALSPALHFRDVRTHVLEQISISTVLVVKKTIAILERNRRIDPSASLTQTRALGQVRRHAHPLAVDALAPGHPWQQIICDYPALLIEEVNSNRHQKFVCCRPASQSVTCRFCLIPQPGFPVRESLSHLPRNCLTTKVRDEVVIYLADNQIATEDRVGILNEKRIAKRVFSIAVEEQLEVCAVRPVRVVKVHEALTVVDEASKVPLIDRPNGRSHGNFPGSLSSHVERNLVGVQHTIQKGNQPFVQPGIFTALPISNHRLIQIRQVNHFRIARIRIFDFHHTPFHCTHQRQT